MGGCVSKAMMVRNDHSAIPHDGVLSYHDLPKPLITLITDDEDGLSGVYARAGMDAEAVKQYQDAAYHNGTMVSRFKGTCVKYGGRNAVGVRQVDRIEKTTIIQNGKEKKWEFVHHKPTVTYTYAQLWDFVETLGRGLIEIGVKPGTNIGLYEETRMEWLVACYGIWCAGAVGVTVYANLGEDALVYAMKEAELSYMFCNGKLVKNLIKLCTAAKIAIPTIIYTDDLPADLDLGGVKAFS